MSVFGGLRLLAGVGVSLLAIAAAIYSLREALPPREITLLAGSEGGTVPALVERYQKALTKEGITITFRRTAGTIASLDALVKEKSSTAIAIVQGGIKPEQGSDELMSLGSIYYEALWIFHRVGERLTSLRQLKGRRIAIGRDGSGTERLTVSLLNANGVTAENATLITVGGEDAATQLSAGTIDAMFIIAPDRSGLIERILQIKNIRILDLTNAEAYTRRFPFLSKVSLPAGVLDFARNVPSEEINLVAPRANLVANKALHPALTEILVEIISRVHRERTLFHDNTDDDDKLPSGKNQEFDLADAADRYFESGKSELRRYFPFWMTAFIQRFSPFVLPLFGFLPLYMLPTFIAWSDQRRKRRYYEQLALIIERAERREATAEQTLDALNSLDESLRTCRIPPRIMSDIFVLQERIEKLQAQYANSSAAQSSR